MARSITTCEGLEIKIGDKVRHKPTGTVIKVCGGFINDEKMFNAEECELCSDDTPTTKEEHDKKKKKADKDSRDAGLKGSIGGGQDESDCVVWGS